MIRIQAIPLYAVIIFSFLSLFSCSKTSDIERLNQQIDALVISIEEHKEQEIKSYLAKDFSVAEKLNKTQFFLFVRHHLKRNKSISISIIDKKITLNELYADITADVLLLGSSKWLPERGQMYKIASRWKKEKGNWMMSRLRWEKK